MEEDIKLLKEMKENCLKKRTFYIDDKAEKKAMAIDNIINRNKELKNSLIDMLNQFAYEDNNPKTKGSSLEKLYTGGLSALENAFNTLNIDEGIEREELWKLLED